VFCKVFAEIREEIKLRIIWENLVHVLNITNCAIHIIRYGVSPLTSSLLTKVRCTVVSQFEFWRS
jgi:hypothetical protein